MSKRKDTNAQVPADQQPKTVVDPKPEAGGASEAEAGMAVDSGSAAETIAEEQSAEPDAPALVHDEGQVSDGRSADDSAPEDAGGTEDPATGDAGPAGKADLADNPAEGQSPADEGLDGAGEDLTDVSQSATDAAAGGASGTAGVQSADTGRDAGDDGADTIDAAGQGDDADGSADPGPGAGSGTAPADASETTAGLTDDDDTERCLACGEILAEGDLVFDDFVNGGIGHAECAGTDPTHFHDAYGEPLKEGDPLPTPHPYEKPSTIEARLAGRRIPVSDHVVYAAEQATYAVVHHISGHFPLSDEEHATVLAIAGFSDAGSGPTNGMAALIRQIGTERATPAVLGQQLKIDGHLESGELTLAQALAVKVYATIVQELDRFEKDYLEANKPKPAPADPRPVPIDETTLEPVDGPMETWS